MKEEYEGSDGVKKVKLLTLKREFKLMRTKEHETHKGYINILMNVVNQRKLLG